MKNVGLGVIYSSLRSDGWVAECEPRPGAGHTHAQEAAMVVPPLRRSRICWQSCRERRSPTRSRVRLASARRRARCPGGVSRGMGRWRQARRMAWARSLSPRTQSPSAGRREHNTLRFHVTKYCS